MSESITTLANPAARLFTPGQLSIGLNLPLVRPGQRDIDAVAQRALARRADAAGFRALWVRDVPLNSADYPDPLGHLDPWSWLGALAVETQRAMLVSGAIVLPLRHPLHVAKAAVSVAALSGGRFVLGLGAGDRAGEFAAFGRDVGARRRVFAEHWTQLALALGEPASVASDRQEAEMPALRLEPRPPSPVPLLAVGSGGQSVNWIARHAIGWMTYHREPAQQRDRYQLWRKAVERSVPGEFRAFGEAMHLALDAAPDAPVTPISLGYRSGRHALVVGLSRLREMGVHHVSLHLELGERPAESVIDELATDVLPHFHRS